MSPFMDKINLFLKLDEKSRDHEVIIGESDNSESPISTEFKRKIFYSQHPGLDVNDPPSLRPFLLDYQGLITGEMRRECYLVLNANL